MEKYRKYYGIMIFVLAVIVLLALAYLSIYPGIKNLNDLNASVQSQQSDLNNKIEKRKNIEKKKQQLRDSLISSQKKIYAPVDTGIEQDSLFFILYRDVIEMLHSNYVKIKSIDYAYNPASDVFVEAGNDKYFVCDVNMEVASNYVNLGKFIQDLYQYPYYIRINKVDIKPYKHDKKILISEISLRLYAHTSPNNDFLMESEPINGASTPLPQ